MKLKANDTLHVSSVKADNILQGEQFEVADNVGKLLVDRGLATEIKPSTEVKTENKGSVSVAKKAK